ncbi:hypothetical protein [Neisseria yangbaofengii]|uniref:hypothetical protein n=1 Tax=Neisseria yangbaofengii TaxID=2709396 RepID=UPI0013EBF994|nr:hypothetical protein [Neisseria yangbaofengii]
MAKIIITIQDDMPVNGDSSVTITYGGDFELKGKPTMAQITAYNFKKLMDAVEFEAAKRANKANKVN